MPHDSVGHAGAVPPAKTTKPVTKCQACEAVCCRLTVVLQPEDDIPAHLTTYLPEGQHVMAHAEDGWCVALDRVHMNCGIYSIRPDVCRRFVMGGAYCNAIRTRSARSIEIAVK
jgi:Fe-S-cluster containining protein